MYENNSAAEMYDRLYQDRKDYRAEAGQVADLVRSRKPDATSLLDVACGTGIHLAAFAELFDRVEGADLSEPMLKVAAERLDGGVRLHHVDMRNFQLDGTFDAITVMFSSIAYLRTTEDLSAALTAFSKHLTPGGVVVIEPWWFPEAFIEGYVSGHALTTDDNRTITRVSHSTRVGNLARMELHYVTADSQGVRHRSEIDDLTLFTRVEYEDAFEQAGLRAEYVASEPGRPGYFVATA
ncbi:class I SAM-dependent methyltransferase [Streptomyces sp. CA-210063]|uniref:class I SAM-dependent DNA methyltransferase n=1 Tax=Streptomyces sp. CA-210063 TaxID=2801029 RepID=UPI00214B1334|nr:class I SAM-dependent methyltransferase [Streptomyces sp. CA-210063]UUU30219.1 class I SAM-dependent methyltransferase [Streptomyces sp. CA-210063]